MAGFSVDGLDNLMLSLAEVAEIPGDIQDNMLNAQADIVVRAQKSKGSAYGVHLTGVTLGAIKKGKPKKSKDGRSVLVRLTGKNADGNANTEVAFLNEFGKKNQRARPFIKDANESSAEETTAAGFRIYDEWLKSKNL